MKISKKKMEMGKIKKEKKMNKNKLGMSKKMCYEDKKKKTWE